MLSVQAISTISTLFPDVPENHPHSQSIRETQELGIVSGYPDGTYKPDQEINRAEFSKIILEAVFETIPDAKEANCLSDISPDQWFQKYVCYAKAQKIIQGYEDGTFKPSKNINLAESFKILFNTFDLPTVQFITAPENWYEYFTLSLKESFKEDTTLDPSADIAKSITRGEMASLIRHFQKVKEEMTPKISKAPGTFTTPVLLKRSFSDDTLRLSSNIMYPNGCGEPISSVDIAESFPEQLSLSIDEKVQDPKEEICTMALAEHPIEYNMKVSEKATIKSLTAYGNNADFHIYNETAAEVSEKIISFSKGELMEGKITLSAKIPADLSCSILRRTQHIYDGYTPVAHIEIEIEQQTENCNNTMGELEFTIDINPQAELRTVLNGESVKNIVEEE